MAGLSVVAFFSSPVFLLVYTGSLCVSGHADHEKSKYTKASQWSHYTELVDSAVASYTDCSNKDCSCFLSVLTEDLKIWNEKTIKEEDVKAAKAYGVHYQIIKHELYRQQDCMFPFRCSGVEHLIPQVNICPYVSSGVVETSYHKSISVLMSVQAGVRHHWDIMYPAWTFWEGGPAVWPIYPTGLGRWDLQRDIISRAAEKWPWEKKEDQAFFRGSRTSAERDPLILLSRAEPDLVDAQYTKNQAWKSEEDTLYRPPAAEVKLEDHCKYRYLFNFRGVAASFRLKHLFLCNSTVFHVGSEWLEFFYPALKPWVHYIPVKSDLSNARELILFAKENQAIVQGIAERGRRFIMEHLRMEDITCYWKKLLLSYAQLQSYKPVQNNSLKQIKRTSPHGTTA
ncbi:unnamed protein product [Candidula unifasciata]|uniref:Glycosyl transferase CAP10 domain-containing protein n=1 Tax=Candidula unifasciata TaxID=100452 RepID=A0A8S3YKT7_9EUPU|nr:unnamed protein product [Candidula unifasciata]